MHGISLLTKQSDIQLYHALRLLVWRVFLFLICHTLLDLVHEVFLVGYSLSCLHRYSVRVRQMVNAKNADMKQSWNISCFHQFVSLWIQIIRLLVIHDSLAETEHLIMTVLTLGFNLVSPDFLPALLFLRHVVL